MNENNKKKGQKKKTVKFDAKNKKKLSAKEKKRVKELNDRALKRAQELAASHAKSMASLAKLNDIQLSKTIADFTKSQNAYLKTIHETQKTLIEPIASIQNVIKPFLESANLFRSIALQYQESFKVYEGLIIDIPSINIDKSLHIGANLKVQIEAFHKVYNQRNYTLTGNVTETHVHQNIEISTTAHFQLKLNSLEKKVDKTNALTLENSKKMDYLIKDSKAKDEVIADLIEYIKDNGSGLAQIKKVTYNKRTTEITLDKTVVKLRGNSNQSMICQVLLSNKKNLSKKWEMCDIIEAIGEEHSDKKWERAIYDALNEVNQKIKDASNGQITNFFILTMKTVTINPKYLT